MSNKSTSGCQSIHRRWYLIGSLGFIVALVLFFVLPYFVSSSSEDFIVRIPKNATLDNVKDSISKYAGDDYASKTVFVMGMMSSDISDRTGLYTIRKDFSPIKAARILCRGAQTPVKLVFNGARTVDDLSSFFSSKLDIEKAEILSAFSNREFLDRYGLTPETAISIFLEDTFEFYWSADVADVFGKFAENYSDFWNQSRIEKSERLGLTPTEVTIVASITDEESNKSDEKDEIGRLYINRLNKGMKLQADPTVKYAVGDFTIRRITKNHLSVESPYNTYRVKGLPPGPIRTTRKQTIDAILNSEPSDYIFMCAKEDFSGYHNFASTYEEHLKNAKKYQEELNRRGIK